MGAPTYSEGGLQVRDIFFARVARTHIFVEDENLENVYVTLVERLFPRLRDFEVFPLSGKSNVLAHSELEAAVGVTRIYVLDKDFDDILQRMVDKETVFYLDHYSIETAVIDEASLLRICVEERPRVRRAELRSRLDLDQAASDWFPVLDRLHRAFALVQKHALPLQSTDLAPEYFSSNGDPSSISASKVNSYIEDVSARLIDSGVIASFEEYLKLSRRVFSTTRLCMKHINGKFLARLYFHRMKRRRLVTNLTQDSLLMRCVGSSDLKGFVSFKRRVASYLRAQMRL